MSFAHLAAIVPVAVLGFAAVDLLASWAKRRREIAQREDLELVRCCCGEHRTP